MRNLLESYNLRVLRMCARRHLPQKGRADAAPKSRKKAYERWLHLVHRATKDELISALLPYVTESIAPSLGELQILDEHRKESRHRKSGVLSDAGRRAHNKYHREVVTPRKKATRNYMSENPELVEEIRRKHGLA